VNRKNPEAHSVLDTDDAWAVGHDNDIIGRRRGSGKLTTPAHVLLAIGRLQHLSDEQCSQSLYTQRLVTQGFSVMNNKNIFRTRLSLLIALVSGLSPLALAGTAADNLAAAIRFPTVSHQDRTLMDVDAFVGLHQFLRTTYPRVFNELEVELVNKYSLLITWPGQDSSLNPVLFTAHIDVVPVEPGTEADWTHPAFAGVVDKGIVYGRGTIDDKMGVISLLEATERLLSQGYKPQRKIVFGFGHDEEIGGAQGAGEISKRLREKGLHFDWMVDEGGFILGDSPMLPGRPVVMIGVAEKQYLSLKLTTTGEGGHSSRPPPQTTIGQLSAAVVKVENNPFPEKLVPPIDAMLQGMVPYVEFPQSFLLGNLWLTSGLIASYMADDIATSAFVRTTTALTMFNAGIKDNVIPQQATAYINFRLLPGDTPEMVVEHVRNVIDDPGVDIEMLPWEGASSGVADIEGVGYDLISKAALENYDKAAVMPYLLPATTDTRHYVDLADNHYRFHGMLVSMAQTSQIHGTNEQISVDSFETAVDIAQSMLEMASQP